MELLKWALFLIAAIAIVTALVMAGGIILVLGLIAGALLNIFGLVGMLASAIKTAFEDKDSK